MRTRAALLAAMAMPATAVIRVIEKGTPDGAQPKFRKSTWRNRITSHETFTHDSLDSLSYDWKRIGNPHIKPRFPLKIYLPQTTDDIVKVLKEVKALGEKLAIRSKGHSSNDLVLTEPGGSVLVTEKLNQVLEIDEDNMTVTVPAGAVSAQVDDRLSTMGLGLPIIGDHNHITVGGFASVGGISPASHRFGLFVDTVQRIEYVNWDGELIAASRTENPEQFFAVLTGGGQHGVIATVTVQIIKVDKYGTVLENHQNHYYEVDAFIQGAGDGIRHPGDALMERGIWLNYAVPGGRSICADQFSAYHPTGQTQMAHLRDQISYNYLNGLGFVAGRLPRTLDKAMNFVGMMGVLFSPSYATMKNVEFFTDKILDSTVGDPTRMFHHPGSPRPLRHPVPHRLRSHARVPGAVRVLHVHVGVREEHQIAVPGPGRSQRPFLRADVLQRDRAGEDRARARGAGRPLRRHRHRQRWVPLHAQPHVEGPGTATQGRPQLPLLTARRLLDEWAGGPMNAAAGIAFRPPRTLEDAPHGA